MFERTTVTSRPDLRRGTASRQFHQELFNNVRDVVVLVALPTSPASIIFGNIEALVEEGSAHRHELGLIRSASTEQPSLVAIDRQSSEVLGKLQLTESQAREAGFETALVRLGEARTFALAHGTEGVSLQRVGEPSVSTGIPRTSSTEARTHSITPASNEKFEASTRSRISHSAPEAIPGYLDRPFSERRIRLEGGSKLSK